MPRKTLAAIGALGALAIPSVALAQMPTSPPPPVTASNIIKTDQSWTLASNTTQTFRVPINGLGQHANALEPCFGFDINGPGVSYAAADLDFFGVTYAEPAAGDVPDGGIEGAGYESDGTLYKPESKVKLYAESERRGPECAANGWSFRDAQGNPAPFTKRGVDATVAHRRGSKKRKRHDSTKPVNVLLGALESARDGKTYITVRVATGRLQGTTTLSSHARVVKQG